MSKVFSFILCALLAITLLTACEKPTEASQIPQPSPTATTKRTLLLFNNPAGVPCQMQEKIIAELGSQLTDQVNILSVSTEVPNDRALFGHYGIRALPTLILIDSEQKEVKRFPPGIQNGAYILQVLAGN